MKESQQQHRSKLIDLRFVVDVVLARYYMVLLVGRDKRAEPRRIEGINQVVDIGVAGLLLVGLNILITSILVLIFYLLKSALGINLLPGHLGQC